MKYTDTTTPKVLAYLLVVLIACTEASLFFVDIPTANRDSINNIIQTLLALMVAAVSYHVGSSSSSATKTSLAAREAELTPPSQPEPTRPS